MRLTLTALLLVTLVAPVAGCSILDGRPQLLPNDNPALRRKPAEFAADAATRQPYPADAIVADTPDVRGEIDYTFDTVLLLNFSGQNYQAVEVWINEQYVVYLPLLADDDLQKIPFRAFYNGSGEHFPTNNRNATVQTLRLIVDGEALEVPTDIKD